MEFVIVPLVSMIVAALTLVSGFGLGTVLMPVFAIFFPVEVAIAATGVVHFVNNLFKLGLVGRHADRHVVLAFGLPAILAAFAGAWLMTRLADAQPLHTYTIGVVHAEVTWLKLATGVLLGVLATLELLPWYQRLAFPRAVLPFGGVLSGFIGGVSGMQGALRAPFLLKAGLSKEQFVGSANVISTIVDAARLLVYAVSFGGIAAHRADDGRWNEHLVWLVVLSCLTACAGAVGGKRVMSKLTLGHIRRIVTAFLYLVAIALVMGVVS